MDCSRATQPLASTAEKSVVSNAGASLRANVVLPVPGMPPTIITIGKRSHITVQPFQQQFTDTVACPRAQCQNYIAGRHFGKEQFTRLFNTTAVAD